MTTLENNTVSIDKLTGLINRKGLIEEANLLSEKGCVLTVITVKLSRFKQLNDGLGNDLGDRVIAQVAKRLTKTFKNASLIGRMAGSNFCLVFDNIDQQQVEHEISRLRDFAERPILLQREVIVLSVNVGVADNQSGIKETSELINAAEIALHNNQVCQLKVSFFHPQMKREAQTAHKLENDLRVALVNQATQLHNAEQSDEFFLMYQPIMSSDESYPDALEALVRWKHPTQGIISPIDFINIAEQINIIGLLGRWILRRACITAVSWPACNNGHLPNVSVNLSASQLIEDDSIYIIVKEALEESGLNPRRLKLEVTESQAITGNMIDTITKLKSLGCTIALDDFGTGFSSLMLLSKLPIDFVKIDRSFVKHIGSDDELQEQQTIKIIKSIVALVDVLDLEPIMEGVETEAQLNAVTNLGIDLIQGYYFSKPLNQEDVIPFILSKQ